MPIPTIRNNVNTDTVEVVGSPTEVAKGETADRGGNSSKTLSSDTKDTTNTEKVKSLEQENTNATKNKMQNYIKRNHHLKPRPFKKNINQLPFQVMTLQRYNKKLKQSKKIFQKF